MFTNRLFHLLIVVGLLVITACTPQVEATSEVTSASIATAVPVDTTTFAPTITPTFVPPVTTQPTKVPTAMPANLPFPIGKFAYQNDPSSYFTFSEDGRWAHHYAGGSLLVAGTYRVEGNTYFQLTSSDGCSPTSFRFAFDGTFLKFQLTDESRNDTCGDRKDAYNNRSYILSP